jgi:hypothetical protein
MQAVAEDGVPGRATLQDSANCIRGTAQGEQGGVPPVVTVAFAIERAGA